MTIMSHNIIVLNAQIFKYFCEILALISPLSSFFVHHSHRHRQSYLISAPGWGDTCLIFVCRCANAVSETVPFLLHFLGKRHPFSCNFLVKNMLFSLQILPKRRIYPFLNRTAEGWRVALKMLRNVVEWYTFCTPIAQWYTFCTPYLLHFDEKKHTLSLAFLVNPRYLIYREYPPPRDLSTDLMEQV